MKPLIWVIDEEWPDYKLEKQVFDAAFPEYDLRFSSNTYADDLRAFGYRADAVIAQISVDVNAELITKLESCKVISVYGSGYNNVDVDAARAKGIPVTFVPGYCAQDIAEYVLAAICHFQKGLTGYVDVIAKGLWGAQAEPQPGHRIGAGTLLVAGFGRIGGMAAQKAAALGMRVLAYDPFVREEALQPSGAKAVSLEEGLTQADFVSVHTPYTPGMKPLFSDAEFKQMKQTAVLINASRGGVIDQDALVRAVAAGEIRGAALDVLKTEPPMSDDPVLHTPGILVTPHISYLSEDSLAELQTRAAKNVASILSGQAGADIVPECRF